MTRSSSVSCRLTTTRANAASVLLQTSAVAIILFFTGSSSLVVDAKKVVNFNSETDAKPASNLKGIEFKSRVYLPYGLDVYSDNPPQESGDRPLKGYGFGMGAAETVAYDTMNHYLYAGSVHGFVTITDYADPTQPQVTDLALEVRDEIVSMTICDQQGLLFLAFEDDGVVEIYDTVQRSSPTKEPKLRTVVEVGDLPVHILANSNCSIVAVCNANDGEGTAEGAITLLRNVENDEPEVTHIPIDNELEPWDDHYALRKGLHMPLTRNALEYWDDYSSIKDELNWAHVRDNYKTAIFLEPASLAWSGVDESELLVILQTNNGIVRVDVSNNRALALAGLGLKDHGVIPIDINDNDGTCDLKTYPHLFSMRTPEGVGTLTYNGRRYLITANEGSDRGYDEWSDDHDAEEVFTGTEFALDNMRVVPSVFWNGTGSSAIFNSDCDGDDCAGGVKISTGSSAIDFELDPTNPKFHRMVLFVGRGWSIFEMPEDPDDLLKLVFDSADDAERTSCEHFPWAYNALTEEEMAPAEDFPNNTLWRFANEDEDEDLVEELLENNDIDENGCMDRGDGIPGPCPMSETVDAESKESGPAFENAAVGVACGRLVAVLATEKSSVGWLYDITNIVQPDLIQVFSLSPISETKSPGLAYNEGTLGEIDLQRYFILDASESPTGKAAVIFDGGNSGTMSYWEFDCVEPDDPTRVSTTTTLEKDNSQTSSSGSSAAVSWGLVGAKTAEDMLTAGGWWWTFRGVLEGLFVFWLIC